MHITCLLKCSSCPNTVEKHMWIVNGQCSCVQLKCQLGFQVGKINSKTQHSLVSELSYPIQCLLLKKESIASDHHLESYKITWLWWPLPYSLPLSLRVTRFR